MKKIIGFVGNITPESISGWAMDKTLPQSSLVLNVEIDGEKVKSTNANKFREDLFKKKIHPTGCCGFSTNLPEPIYDFQRIKVFIQGTDVEIPWSSHLLQTEKKKIWKSKEKYFFIHIPKTAGTSFRTMLYRQFHQQAVYPQFKDIKESTTYYNDWGNLTRLNDEELNNIGLFTGHFPYSTQKFFKSTQVQVLTVLRNPVKRVYSLLAHLQRHNKNFTGLSLEEIFALEKQGTSNGITRLFISSFSKSQLDQDDLQEAKSNLRKSALIGLSEYFEETIQLAEKKFNWSLGENVKANVGNKYMEKISPSLMAEIINKNKMDAELYSFAKEIFFEELKLYDIPINH